jgi:cation transport ATPase
LTGLLWLKNPTKLIEKVKSVGLSELMAMTLNEEIASKELINEFESTIKGLEGISEDDYRVLLESVAHESAKKIEQFNEVAEQDKEKAKVIAHKIVEKERSRRAKNVKEIKEAQAAKNQEVSKSKELQERLNKIESDLAQAQSSSETSQTQLEVLSEKVIKQERLLKRIIWTFIITVIVAGIALAGFYFYESLNWIVKIFNWILSAGGLFGLGNLIFNAIKFFKGK